MYFVKEATVSPEFEALTMSINDAERKGAFQDLDSRILDLMNGMFPVEIESGRILPPRDYDPMHEIPVVLGARPKQIEVSGLIRASARRKLPHATHQSASEYHVKSNKSAGEITVGDCVAINPWGSEMLILPAYMYIDTRRKRGVPSITAHEVDHWDFFMGLNGFSKENADAIVTQSERRAFNTSLKVELALGDVTPSDVKHFEDMVKGDVPSRFNIERIKWAQELGINSSTYSVVANALTSRFGPTSINAPATPHEVRAYQMAGIACRTKTT